MDSLEAYQTYLRECLKQLKRAQEAVPDIERQIETLAWVSDALSNRPVDAPQGNFLNAIDTILEHGTGVLPMLPTWSLEGVRTTVELFRNKRIR